MDKKEMFERYEQIRLTGLFNMITEASYAMEAAGLDKEQYFYVIGHYSELREKYGK